MKRFLGSLVILLGILWVALLFRLVGLNWDDYSRLHPDERFMNGIVERIGEERRLTDRARERCPDPASHHQYFNTSCSVLNPSNIDDGSYVYGTLPLFIVRGVAQNLALLNPWNLEDPNLWTHYDTIHLVGRFSNAVADTLSALLIFLMGWRLFSVRHGLLAAALYAAAVLPIQLSHFWTVDTMSHLFFLVAFYAAVEVSRNNRPWWYVLFGLALGAALASRVNLAPTAILLPLAAWLYLDRHRVPGAGGGWHWHYLPFIGATLWGGILLYSTPWVIDHAPLLPDTPLSDAQANDLRPVALIMVLGLGGVAILLPLAALRGPEHAPWRGWWLRALSTIALCFGAAALSVVSFRVFQPYAFAGPTFADWDLNPEWVREIQEVSEKKPLPHRWLAALRAVVRAHALRLRLV
ncbi:MAG: phospholipid carrier-dependent glycosyltransferase [Anaerolineae bacterium]|nr:phospholipid carrier-dependent glycosyltransferase [Anaerolineae bacterium]